MQSPLFFSFFSCKKHTIIFTYRLKCDPPGAHFEPSQVDEINPKKIQVDFGRKYFENKHKPKIIEQPISKFLDLSLNAAMHVKQMIRSAQCRGLDIWLGAYPPPTGCGTALGETQKVLL